jgi:N-sulfoglucosamine sulfohydrolase
MTSFAALLALSAVAAAERPNVLLIISDDHTAAHVGCYGNPDVKTPNLDRLAAEGIRFDRFYVAAPQCVPSRAAFMTGRSPVAIDMTRFSAPLPREIVAFPELLRKAGYHTGITGRSYHLDGGGRMPPDTERVFEQHHLRTFDDRVDWLKPDGDRTKIPALVTEFLELVPDSKPFFLQVGSSDPHRPFNAGSGTTPPERLTLPPHFPDTPALRKDFSEYYGEIERLDGDLGAVLRLLEESGHAADTLVIFVGDNGCALLRGKGTLFDFGIRVPLIVRWPGMAKGGDVAHEITSGEDLAPSILEACGVTPPDSMTGRSFAKRLRAEPFEPRTYAFAERGAHGSGLPTNTGAFDLARCVVGERYKLIYTALPQLPYSPVDFAGNAFWKEIVGSNESGHLEPQFAALYFPPQRPMFQLFDLQSDPHELTNLAGQRETAAVERQLKAALQEWMILERDYLPLPIPPGDGAQNRGAQRRSQARNARAVSPGVSP